MAIIRKRQLTTQQSRRIQKQQQTHQQIDDDNLMDGLVIANYGKQLDVQTLSLPKIIPTRPTKLTNDPKPFWQPIELHSIWRCHTRTNLPLIATGDKVRLIADPNTGLGRIETIYPRHNVINRPDRYHKLKPVASNVDILAIVFAPLPAPSAQLIDRYLVACHHANIQPLLVLNKTDLTNEPTFTTALQLLKEYQQLGYQTLQTQQHGELQSLKNWLNGKTIIFAGQSGVGKSSLINQLIPHADQAVNQISNNAQLGQHTTTTGRLLPFDQQNLSKGAIIDTPGIREYGVWHLEKHDIYQGFIELFPLVRQCRFRDCQHTTNTPNCALWQAVATHQVLARRVESLLALLAESNQNTY